MISENDNEESNIWEILSKLWANKFVFFIIISIFFFSSVFYIYKAEKTYTSSSIFLPKKENNNLNFRDSELSSLTKLAGISALPSNTEEIIERFTGRDFVLELAGELKLYDDRFFNSYDPKIEEPFWAANLKSLLNWESSSSNPVKIAEWNVIQNFKNQITITASPAGAIQITVNHFSPERAAEIANYIMHKIISVLKSENIKDNNYQLDYLSQTLADSLINLEKAQENLKLFMLSNNTAAPESFYKGSIMLDNLRTQLEESKKQISTIDVLLSYAALSTPTFQDYTALRNKYPSVDQSNFRRMLGISEIVSAWSWPSVESLTRVRKSMQDRVSSLETEIRKYEKEAIKHATSAEQLNKLNREMKIAEAAYKVLVEQAKIQSLAAGFTPDTSRIIAAADAAVVATKPNKMLILTLAAVSGFLVSTLVALILSWNKGVVYSSRELLKVSNPNFYHKIRTLKHYRTTTLQEAQDRLIRRPAPWLKQLFLETSTSRGKSPFIFVADTTNFHAADVIARLLAARAHEFDMSMAYFDLSKTIQLQANKQDNQISETKIDIEVAETINGCTEYNYRSGKQNVDWLFSKSFQGTLDFLKTKHDTIIFSANSDVLDLLLASEKLIEAKLVIYASKGKTTYERIRKLSEKGKIEIALLS